MAMGSAAVDATILVGGGYRSTSFSVVCRGQCLSLELFPTPLPGQQFTVDRPNVSIDEFSSIFMAGMANDRLCISSIDRNGYR